MPHPESSSRRRRAAVPLAVLGLLGAGALGAGAAEEWEGILAQALQSKYSKTRHNGVKGIDCSSERGLKVLWKVLAETNPKDTYKQVDWFVREGAYEALVAANSPEAEAEIKTVLEGKGNDAAKEAIVNAVIYKLRKEFVKAEGRNSDEWIEDAKFRLRKTRGPAYFKLILPTIQKVDPDGRLFARLKLAYADSSTRVRQAAITGFMAYPHKDSLPLLFGGLKALEKKQSKLYREWILTRFALEQLTGQDLREDVDAWVKWWEGAEGGFTIEKRIEEAEGEGDAADDGKTKTRTKRKEIETEFESVVRGNPDGYPLLVLSWRQWEPDYFRPWFHGIEEECLCIYVKMPKVGDFKGLPRDAASNLVKYPTDFMADALIDVLESAKQAKGRKMESFGVLGHGPESSLLAMKVAAAHPEAVSHLILIDPRPSGASFGEAVNRVIELGRREKSHELEKGGQSILIDEQGQPLYKAADSDEGEGLGRALQNLNFADPTDPVCGQFQFLYEDGDSAQTLADEGWKAQSLFPRRPNLPVLIFHGTKDPWVSAQDVNSVAGLFNKPQVVSLETSQFPFMFEPYTFNAAVRKFLQKANKSLKAGAKGKKR